MLIVEPFHPILFSGVWDLIKDLIRWLLILGELLLQAWIAAVIDQLLFENGHGLLSSIAIVVTLLLLLRAVLFFLKGIFRLLFRFLRKFFR